MGFGPHSVSQGVGLAPGGADPDRDRRGASSSDQTHVDMRLTIDLPDDAMMRLAVIASARGGSGEHVAAEALAKMALDGGEFAVSVEEVIATHRDFLDRLVDT